MSIRPSGSRAAEEPHRTSPANSGAGPPGAAISIKAEGTTKARTARLNKPVLDFIETPFSLPNETSKDHGCGHYELAAKTLPAIVLIGDRANTTSFRLPHGFGRLRINSGADAPRPNGEGPRRLSDEGHFRGKGKSIEITGHRNRPSRVRFCRLLCLSRTNSRFLEFLDLRRGAGQIPKARKEIEEPHSLLRCLGNHAQASTLSRRRYPPTSWIVRKSAVRLI